MSAQTTIDDRTAEIIRSAMSAAQAGRIKDACEIGERGLAEGGDGPTLHAMIGGLLCSIREFGLAMTHLEIAHKARPADPIVARNLATALVAEGRFEDVLALVDDDVATADSSGMALRLRGYANQQLDQHGEAAADFERVVARFPNDWESWSNLGNSKLDLGRSEEGIAALRRAAQLNPKADMTRFTLAMALRDDGQFGEAEAELLAMADDFPNDPRPFGCLFGLLQMQSLDPLAMEALELALQRSPDDVGMLIALGREQLLSFDFGAAKATFKRVIELDPSNGDAFLGIADAYERADPEQISALIEEAEQNGVDKARINLMRASLARRERKFEEGLAALAEVPENFEVVRRLHLQAQLLDGAKRYDEAFAAFDRANSLIAAEPTNPLQRAADQRALLRGQLQQLTPEWRESWQTPPLTAERPSPVFLLGFPRSGTTLLDTMLMGHPSVEVMEEKPILSRLRLDGVDFAGLPAMDAAAVRSAQERYFELAADFATLKGGTVLVDKSPLHMQHLAQIHRLFPDARIILALRHPVDVVLSAFMAKFRPNNSMANFLRIDTAAEFYDLTFALWERALALFPAEVFPVVYEEMIDDPEASLRPLIAKLGIEWDQSVLDHQTTAKARGIITTASYDQVTQPLYRRSAGRWKHYRRHLEPIFPILRPWVEKFGYEL